MTIHKSQGQTHKSIAVDFGTGAFAHGQAYVALSRCQSLEGLYLKKPLIESDIILDKHVIDFLSNKATYAQQTQIDMEEFEMLPFCSNCGAKFTNETNRFCTKCGVPRSSSKNKAAGSREALRQLTKKELEIDFHKELLRCTNILAENGYRANFIKKMINDKV